MVRILETNLIGYLADSLVSFQQTVFHFADDGEMDVFNGRLAGLFLHEVAEVIGRKMKLVGTPCY